MAASNGVRAFTASAPTASLRPTADMAARWRDDDLDFDSAANALVDAHARDGAAHDLPLLDLRTWAVVPHQSAFALAPLARHHEPKPLRATAFSNLMSRIGAPADFVRDRLPAPLQLATTNYLLAALQEATPATLRLRGDDVAAVVSSRYAPLDPVELVDTVRSALVRHGALDEVRVRSVATGVVDVLRLVFPSATTAVKVGDVSALGLDISSSCFGRSAIHVRGLVWRLRCTNGLRTSEQMGSFSIRHVGESRRLRDGVTEAIPTVLTHARGTMAQWRRAVDFMVDDVAKQIEAMRELSVVEQKLVAAELKRETGAPQLPARIDLYALLNAITSSAKEAVPARRIEIEAIAGQVLHARVGGAS